MERQANSSKMDPPAVSKPPLKDALPQQASRTEHPPTDIPNFGVLDIETQRSAAEVGGWHRADRMKVSCAVLYDSKADRFLEFQEDEVVDMVVLYCGGLASIVLLLVMMVSAEFGARPKTDNTD